MIDIRSALEEAVNLASQADKNNKEIDQVIESIGQQISDFSGGNTQMVVRAKEFGESSFEDLKYRSQFIVELKALDETHRIAGFGRSQMGYPCSVVFGGGAIQALDKEALGLAFLDLLKTHRVGTILFSSMKR